ncbi:glycosyltransferase [Bacillaceae bacterium Marseille-Q3522]|nr:glycosyltransferase [Bacillaceae bacterium Marseille-Q3522]
MNDKRIQNKKKVLHIVEAMGGGVFTYIIDLTNQLNKKFDQYVAYAIRPQTPKNYKEYFSNNVILIEVENFTRSLNPLKDFKAFFEIKEIAKKVKPDIIHLHSSKAGVLGRWAFDGNKIPIFYTPHGYSFLMQNNGWAKRTIYKIIEMLSSKRLCTTISCSLGEHQETLKFTNRAVYINNGINIADLQNVMERIKEKKSSHSFTVYTLGRICYQKNPEQFNAIAQLLPDVKFLWIGDGELREKLTSSNIEITGWVDRETALTHTVNADVFLLTSLWEGLPISLLESMYMKKICVVSNVIGNKDVIFDEYNGFVCNTLDEFIKALRLAKDIIIDEDVNGQLMMERAYQDILCTFNIDVMGDKYKDIYLKKIR